MNQVYNLKGILRGKNTDKTNGLPLGCVLERIKDGQPTGQQHGYWLGENKITEEAIGQLEGLNNGEEISYQSADYRILKIGKPGAFSNGGGRGGYAPQTPEERRSIELQSTFKTCADVMISCLEKSKGGEVSYSAIMTEVWTETLKYSDLIREEAKKAGGQTS